MYSLLMVGRDGQPHTHMKGKGVPKRVLAAKASHAAYRETLFDLQPRSATFSSLRSYNHTGMVQDNTKKLLTAFNDKVMQLDRLCSRPLGHWRNTFATMPGSAASVGEAASAAASRSEAPAGETQAASSSSGY